MRNKVCKQCSSKLTGRQLSFCSDDCRYEYHNDGKKLVKECELCGKPTRNKFCSKDCREEFHNAKKRKSFVDLVCQVCGVKFTPKHSRQKNCSTECFTKKTRPPKPPKNCVTCGEPSGRKKFCSKKCEHKHYSKPKLKRTVTCEVCGKAWETHHPTARYCSSKCSKSTDEYKAKRNARNRKKNEKSLNSRKVKGTTSVREKLRRSNRKSRLRKHTLPGISLDGFVELEVKRQAGQEKDHIIPLNHPDVCGLNVPWNLQLLTCEANNFKSNKWDGTYDNRAWVGDFKKRRNGSI